jgi:hypothetical protein
MRKSTPDFKIHVDGSCMSDPNTEEHENEAGMSPERVSSNQTVVHHDSWGEADKEEGKSATEELVEEEKLAEKENRVQIEEAIEDEIDEEQAARERQIDRIEAQIHAAARAVVASIAQDHYIGPTDSELSMQTEESYEPEGTELTYDGTELTYDGTEGTYESDHEHHLKHEEEDTGPQQKRDMDQHEEGHLSLDHDAMDESGHEQHSEHEGDSSSQHDGDIDDDVFSHSDQSKRSSLNSIHELSPDDNQKILTSPVVGEEAASSNEDQAISRIPSGASYMHAPADSNPRTPSKVLNRPPFRTPSSVRAIQMSSPTPSIFSSPRSTKRPFPTVSRSGTPNSHNSPSKRTPTRFKPKEAPLVLLHVTVLPLQWPYSHLMSLPDFPEALQNVKESWRLLQEKLGDTVLERGILLPHPQDSYEVLEERLLEALELPVHPRALILKCGHYMGPSETPSSDEDAGGAGEYSWNSAQGRKTWCEICGRDVRIEENGNVPEGERRFRVKIYASNGLMRAGAWAAAWREMERVDVELEPFVEGALAVELEHLATISPSKIPPPHEVHEEEDDGFVDEEEIVIEHVHDHSHEVHEEPVHEEDEASRLKRLQNEERMREIYGPALDTPCPPTRPRPDPHRRTSSRSSGSGRGMINDDSLPDLLLAAFKVAIRDKRNVAIVILSLFILLLSLRPSNVVQRPSAVVMGSQMAPVVQVETTTVFREATVTETIPVAVTTSIMVPIESPTKDAEPIEDPCAGRVPVKEAESQVPVKEAERQVPVIEVPKAPVTQIPVQEVKIQAPVIEAPKVAETQIPVREVDSQVPVIEVQKAKIKPRQQILEPINNAPIPAQETIAPVTEAPLPIQEPEPEQKVIPPSPSPELPVVEVTPQQPIAINSEL